MSEPLVYLTFANQKDAHLELLAREHTRLTDLLLPLETKEFIKLKDEKRVETDDVIKTLSAYPDRLAIFHYGGHAGGKALEFEDRNAQAKGLAALLGEQKNLHLVFLNGCSTVGQVELLLNSGVKAVIATSVPVEDPKALDFAIAFYQALVNKRTLKRAFEFAKASISTKHSNIPDIQVRGKVTFGKEKKEDIPWGLYVKEDASDALDWRLPHYRQIGLPPDMMTYIKEKFKFNRYIVYVLDEMCKYNKDIYSQMVTVEGGKEVRKDSSTYLDIVIQNFPWIIGSQIQLLRSKKNPDLERLEQLVSTYIITSQVLYFILLSNLWDEVRNRKGSAPKGFLKSHQLKEEEILQGDFLGKLLDVYQILKSEKYTLFVPELAAFCDSLADESHLSKAREFLKSVSGDLLTNKAVASEEQCIKVEQALAIILKSAAFLADYRMLTVRNISIDNPRYGKEVYELSMGALNALVNTSLSLYEDQDKRRKENYSNCKSIVLVQNELDLSHSLNLTPFIIDKNTYLNNDHIDLFLFAYEKDEKYYYVAIKHSLFIALKDEKGTDIIDTSMTFEDFRMGKNITRKEKKDDDDGFAGAFGDTEDQVVVQESPPALSLLEVMFEQFKSDFS